MKTEQNQDSKQESKQHFVPDSNIKFNPPNYRELMKRREILDPIFDEARAALDREIAFQMGYRN